MRKFLFLLLSLVLTISLTSCDIKDTNGSDDYSLTVITEEDIVVGAFSSFSSFMEVESSSLLYGELDGTYNVEKLSGIKILNYYSTSSPNVKITIDFTCEEGNALLAIVGDNGIVLKIEPNQSNTFTFDNSSSTYKIVLAGESAKISLSYVMVGLN